MEKKKKNQVNPAVKNYISTALFLLMEQKDYQDITVTDIAKKAGVSRMTYYRTYSSKEDILIQYFNDTTSELLNEIKSYQNITMHPLSVIFFTFFQEHKNLIPLLKKANLQELVFHNFIRNLKHLYTELLGSEKISDADNFHLHFNAGGLSFALILWIENGCKETPEQLAQLMDSFMTPPSNL